MNNGFNRNQLKYIAVIAMLVDHIGMFFVPITTPLGLLLRIIGRLTAPIMCFFIAEGYFYTRSKFRYGMRLFIFALISQIPYSFAHDGVCFTFDFSVIYTFFIGFLVLLSYDKITNKVLKWAVIFLLIVVSYFGDWGVFAPLWILVFWAYRDNMRMKIIGYSFVCVLLMGIATSAMMSAGYNWYSQLWQAGTFLAIGLIAGYNGEKGSGGKFGKWFFYVFYPVHLVLLKLIEIYLVG